MRIRGLIGGFRKRIKKKKPLQYLEDIQLFDVEYGIYFISGTGFLIFSRVRSI